MEFRMERWYSAVGQRFSVRKYAGGPDEQELAQLNAMAKLLSIQGVRVDILQDDRVFAPIFLWYGRIKGTKCFAAFLREGDAPAWAEGYLGEALALECAAMGLGTCWLGMYRKQAAREAVEPREGETLGCIMAIGKPGEPYAPRPRKPLDQLTGLSQEALQALPEWQQRALECARMAPSAVNGQPWRFLPEQDALRIIDAGRNHGYGPLDRGIAMLHVELGAAHCGVTGSWGFAQGDAVFRPGAQEGPEEGGSDQ